MSGLKQVLKLSWDIANKSRNNNNNENGKTLTMIDDKTRIQALALANDCYKYIMDLTTNGVVITDAIKFVQTNKEKLTTMSAKEDDKGSKESLEPGRDKEEVLDQLEEEQEEETEELNKGETTNQVF
jgi:hypothetical protein